MRNNPPQYFAEAQQEPVVSNYRKAFKPDLPKAPVKKPVNNAKESAQGFSAYDFESAPDANQSTTQTTACPDCGRSFNPESYQKHIKICKKVFMKKRKQFDSTEQRANGEEPVVKSNPRPQKKTNANGKWKAQSEQFRANLQAARLADSGDTEGARRAAEKAQEHEKASMVRCDNCGRTFNEDAAARHVPICRKNAQASQFKRGGKVGKARR